MLVVLLLTPVVVIGGWAAVAAQPNRAASAGAVEPVVVEPVLERAVFSVPQTLTVEVGAGHEVRSQASGLVTRAPEPGGVLDQGDVVVVLDDRPVRAFVGQTPFWRPLAEGDRGDDVRALQEYLVATGLSTATPDGVFGGRLRSAVATFNTQAGLGRGVGTFDPATVAWVGPEPLTVASVPVRVGDAVAPGQAVAVGPADPVAIAVSTVTEGAASVPDDLTGPFELVVGAVVVPYDGRSPQVLDVHAVGAIATEIAPATSVQGLLRATSAREVLVVPASALVQGDDGTTCLYPGPRAAPVAVVPVGGGIASVQLDPATPLDSVLVNPGEVVPDEPCAS